jgi:hypothetical protein
MVALMRWSNLIGDGVRSALAKVAKHRKATPPIIDQWDEARGDWPGGFCGSSSNPVDRLTRNFGSTPGRMIKIDSA